jgi:hypothetical protein
VLGGNPFDPERSRERRITEATSASLCSETLAEHHEGWRYSVRPQG